MGARIDSGSHIHITDKTYENGVLDFIGYKDISQDVIEEIVQNKKIKRIQISQELPVEAYQIIDQILEKRSDLYFRVFNFYGEKIINLSFLENIPHLSKLMVDSHLVEDKNTINAEYLCELRSLNGLHLNLFDCRDYSFINNLSGNLEELFIYADTMGGAIKFDCEWLSQYKKLHTLYLGKKAKKHLECIRQISGLKRLSLRGIKLEDFSFLKEMCLESLSLLWCGNSDLSGLAELITLRELELWRIMKLDNLDFVSSLVNLEVLKLQDLKHIKVLPDMSRLTKMKEIIIDNVPIEVDVLDESVGRLVR